MISDPLPLDQLPDALDTVYAYWCELGGEALNCSWRKFRLDKLPPKILPYTLVVDVKPDITKNIYRYWGTGMTRVHLVDLTGKTTSVVKPAELAQTIQKSHSETVKTKKASASSFAFKKHKGLEHHQDVLRLPLSDDGVNVTHIVVSIEMTNEGQLRVHKNQMAGVPTR